MNLYRVTNYDAPENQVECVDEEGKINNCIFTCRVDALIEKQLNDFFERKIICKKKEGNRYKLITEECFNMQTGVPRKPCTL